MRKPRESKYSKMINKHINEVFTDFQMKLESENYLITDYDNPQRVSSSGRVYRTYKVQLENSVWISTQMFNKYVKRGFFSKNVHKKIDNARIFERFNESVNNEFEEVKEETPKQKFEIKVSDYCFKDDTKKSSTGFTFTREQLKGNVYGVDDETYNRAVDAIFVGSSHYLYDENYEKTVQVSSGAYIDFVEKDIDDFKLLTFKGSISKSVGYYKILYRINKEQALKELREERLIHSPKELFIMEKMLFENDIITTTMEMNPYMIIADRIMMEEVMVEADKWAEENWSRYERRWQELEESLNEVNINVSTPDENEFSVHFRNCKTVKDVKKVYRSLAKQYHSDLGGSDEDMAKINTAYDRALSLVA